MGWLDRFLHNNGKIGEDAKEADVKIQEAWKKYFDSVPEKEKIVHAVVVNVVRLKQLLRTELVDLEEDEEEEAEVMLDLASLSHDYRIKSAHRLTQTLDYAERKYEYIYSLVQQIHSVIRREFHLASSLQRAGSNSPKYVIHLQKQVELEILIIKKINELNEKHGPNRFHELFIDLAKGEHIIKSLSERERRLLQKMSERSARIDESLLNKWGARVVQELEERVHEAEAQGLIGYNPDMEFEFVNQSMFEDFVKEVILSIRQENAKGNKKKGLPYDAMINSFIHDFRQWFNSIGLKEE